MSTLTRKGFLKLAGAGAAATALAGTALVRSRGEDAPGLFARRPDMNVVLVIIDTLRRDHVGAYGNGWIQTPNLDAFAKDSLRFTKAYPEAMPTIPARRAIHTGIRTFPFDQYGPEQQRHALMPGWLPIPRSYSTHSYHDYVCPRDESYALICRKDGGRANGPKDGSPGLDTC